MPHKHAFDSACGLVSMGRSGTALMCCCGVWAMPAGGEWHAVPKELLPSACAHLSKRNPGFNWIDYTIVFEALLCIIVLAAIWWAHR